MTAKGRIYLAGPLGFSEAGRHFYNAVLIPFVQGLGYEVLDPWTLTDATRVREVQAMQYGPAKREAWRKLNLEMGATNRAAIDASRAVVAILDGTDVDSGTAAEIGYAFARGKLIVGYRGDFRLSADNEGSIVNLQVEYFIRESGGTIVERYVDLGPTLRSLASPRPAAVRSTGAQPRSRTASRRYAGSKMTGGPARRHGRSTPRKGGAV